MGTTRRATSPCFVNFVSFSSISLTRNAKPKSMTIGSPFADIITFAGFKSR